MRSAAVHIWWYLKVPLVNKGLRSFQNIDGMDICFYLLFPTTTSYQRVCPSWFMVVSFYQRTVDLHKLAFFQYFLSFHMKKNFLFAWESNYFLLIFGNFCKILWNFFSCSFFFSPFKVTYRKYSLTFLQF